MHLITDEGLSLLLKRIRNKIALRSNLDLKVDKEEGKDLSDNDFTNNHKELLNNAIDSVSVEHSTGKSHITFLNSEINNNIKLDIDTGCDLFFYPVLNNASRELDGSIIIPYTYISKEGCDIGKVSVTMSYMYEEDIDPISQVFEINSKENGELVLTNAPDKAGWVNYSFTILGDTDAIKTNFMEYDNVLIKVFASYRTTQYNHTPVDWYFPDKIISEDLGNGTYKTTIYGRENSTNISFSNDKNIREIYHIANHITNMYNAFNNCTNLTGQPICGPNVTDMNHTYYNCSNLTGNPVCGNNVTNMMYAYYKCSNLKGNPVCGNNTTNMCNTYYDCSNLTGNPVCGNNVNNFTSAYSYCGNLTGNPVCGPNVTNMTATYISCSNLTGSPVCGNNVISMSQTYRNCSNLTGSPVCGPKVTDMFNTYALCSNLTGSPVCGENVTKMAYAYMDCYSLTGNPVCGNNVTNMMYAYFNCTNLTGSPACGPNVTDMINTYWNCSNLTGSPACGDKVINMYYTYQYCSNLTGNPVCGPNVNAMVYTYYNCSNLTGNPVCGNNITSMYYTYSGCYNLTGSPVCGNKATDMVNTYDNCYSLTGNPVCGPNVTDMSGTYQNCYNLTGTAVCGDKVTSMYCTYYNCTNLTNAEIGPKVTNTDSCFINCSNLVSVNISNGANTIGDSAFRNCSKIENIIFPPSITSIRSNAFNGCSNLISYDFRNHTMIPALSNSSAFYNINSQCIITVPTALYSDWVVASNWSSYADYIFPDSTEPGIISLADDTVNLDINKTKTVDIMVVNFEDVNSINVSAVSDKTACVSIGNITKVQKNAMCAIISVELITAELEEDTNITLTVSSDKATVDYTFVAKVEEVKVSYTVEAVSGATYGFELNDDGYYESKNKGVQNSYAICKVNIYNPNKDHRVYIDCINYGENGCDYGILSNVDSTLTSSTTADSSGVKKSFSSSSSAEVQPVNYGAIEGTIYIKYRKDSSVDSGNDSLQFKVRFVYIDPNAPQGSYTVESVDGASYGFALNGDYYENQNKQQDSTAALCKVIINNPHSQNIIFNCNQSSESGYDYGILSNVGATLTTTSTADSSGVKKSCKNMNGDFTVDYGAIEGTIYVKYRKDSSASNGTDTFKFKVEFE